MGKYPRKHKVFVYHLYNVGPTSSTLVQHRINFIQMLCVGWDRSLCHVSEYMCIDLQWQGHDDFYAQICIFFPYHNMRQ